MKSAIAFTVTFVIVFTMFMVYGKIFDATQLNIGGVAIASFISAFVSALFIHCTD